jgi:hypothetical protein
VADEAAAPNWRPVWLLDVDGVINGTGRVGWHAPPRTGTAFSDGVGYAFRWAPQLIKEIRILLPEVEMRWATTWIDAGTRQLEDLLGLPALPVAYPPDPDRRSTSPDFRIAHLLAKAHAAVDVVRSGRQLIWSDDDAIPLSGQDRDVLDAAGALLIAPDPRRGLHPHHLDQIQSFIRHHDDKA